MYKMQGKKGIMMSKIIFLKDQKQHLRNILDSIEDPLVRKCVEAQLEDEEYEQKGLSEVTERKPKTVFDYGEEKIDIEDDYR